MTEPETSTPLPENEPAVTAEDPALDQEPLADPLEQALADTEKWKDLAYRSQAELDNYRKRATREGQETRMYANTELLRSILPILDTFEMGLEASRAESEKSMIFMGMQMVHRQFLDFLKDFNVQEIEAQGRPFDPNIHEAVSQEITTDSPDGTIIRVTRRGYRLKERMLRPASVIVASTSAPDAPSEA